MTVQEVLDELKSLSNESTKKVLSKHISGCEVYGVKVEDIKKVLKKIKNQQELAVALFDTNVYEAGYLAGLAANGALMSREQLNAWANKTKEPALCEFSVPWVATENPNGYELAKEWLQSDKESTASVGWTTLSMIVAYKDDKDLNIKELEGFLQHVKNNIAQAPNRVRYAMNGFIIAVGSAVSSLSDLAQSLAKEIGTVTVDMGGTACKVPAAFDYIQKIKDKGQIGKKRKNIKC